MTNPENPPCECGWNKPLFIALHILGQAPSAVTIVCKCPECGKSFEQEINGFSKAPEERNAWTQ